MSDTTMIGKEEYKETDDVTGTLGDEVNSVNSASKGFKVIEQKQRKPEQTLVLFFTGLFKILAFLFYLLGDRIGFISSFVLVVLFLCADFWVVKNVSGRLLAGLRWRNFVREDNSTEWRFESWSPEERRLANKSQIRAFWALLLSQQCLWSTLFVGALFGLHLIWIMIPILALILNSSNTYGYVRCWWEAKSEPRAEGSTFGLNLATGMVQNAWTSLKSFIVNPKGAYSSVPLDETVIHQ